MNLTTYKNLLTEFLSAKEEEIFHRFSALKGAIRTKDYVFIQGNRPDRILFVAHADTAGATAKPVWRGDCATTLGWGDGLWSSRDGKSLVLGADDRAGCALLYNVYDGAHSLLITTGEERGCIGARVAARELKDVLAKHQFAVEVDRRGDRQAVFYNVATKAFKEYILAQLEALDFNREPWSERQGSFTDIAVLCEEAGICGVNLSAGYHNEHGSQEILLLGSWLHTRTVVRRLAQRSTLPQFVLPVEQTRTYPQSGRSKRGSFRGGTPTAKTSPFDPKDIFIIHAKDGPSVVFEGSRKPVGMLSKKQRKRVIRGLLKNVLDNRTTLAHAIGVSNVIRKVWEKDRGLAAVCESLRRELADRAYEEGRITERDRLDVWTGGSWEPRVVGHIDNKKGTHDSGLVKCVHEVFAGRYCEMCAAVIASPLWYARQKDPKVCDHGIPFEQACMQCEMHAIDTASPNKTSLISKSRCIHGVSLSRWCDYCDGDEPETLGRIGETEIVESVTRPLVTPAPSGIRGYLPPVS
jgi:hypothetical protein